MNYLKKNWKWISLILFLCLSYNLYFLFLLPEVRTEYLCYLDLLLFVCIFLFCGAGFLKNQREEKKKKEFLRLSSTIYQNFPQMEDYEIAEHDVAVLEKERNEQFQSNCDLQDYIAKWCHEVKIPLSASLLLNEKIEDKELRFLLREQLERIHQQLKSALLGSKVQGRLFDIQIKSVNLYECVKASIQNNQFFLIRNHFELDIDVDGIFVYTDKSWLVYVLDQLIGNAIKYAADHPALRIFCIQKGASARLFVEDHGEGIKAGDIRRVFEKGYVGSSHHNGQYKSTGMGLYLAARIIEKLGHEISVESREGEYTRFWIDFRTLQDM